MWSSTLKPARNINLLSLLSAVGDDAIFISSGEDSPSAGSQGEGQRRKVKKKKKKRPFNSKELFSKKRYLLVITSP